VFELIRGLFQGDHFFGEYQRNNIEKWPKPCIVSYTF